MNSLSPVIWRSGRTSTPGASIGIASIEMPLCGGASGSVRTSAMPQFANVAYVDHTFWPVTTYTPPRFSARVVSDARSLPASGSLNSWHHTSSPDSIRGIHRRRCSSVPYVISVGPTRLMPARPSSGGASTRASSWL